MDGFFLDTLLLISDKDVPLDFSHMDASLDTSYVHDSLYSVSPVLNSSISFDTFLSCVYDLCIRSVYTICGYLLSTI